MVSGIITFAVLTALGVPFAVPLALWMGLVSQFIPTVGTYIAMALPLLVAVVESPMKAVVLLVFFTAYQQVENYVLSPRITAKTMELHPAVAFGCAIAGASIAGLVGRVHRAAGGRHRAGRGLERPRATRCDRRRPYPRDRPRARRSRSWNAAGRIGNAAKGWSQRCASASPTTTIRRRLTSGRYRQAPSFASGAGDAPRRDPALDLGAGREEDAERSASSLSILDPRASAVQLREPGHEREADAGAGRSARTRSSPAGTVRRSPPAWRQARRARRRRR